MDKEIVISIKTVLFILAFLLVSYVVYLLSPVFLLLLVALLITIAVEPAVQFFKDMTVMNKPMPRSLAVAITYFLLLVFIFLFFTIVIPPIIAQTQTLIALIRSEPDSIPILGNMISSISGDYVERFFSASENIIEVTKSAASSIFAIVSVFALAIYMSIDWINIKTRLFSVVPDGYREEIKEITQEIETSIGQWVKGQVILMFGVGIGTTIGLYVIGVDYALALGALAGVLEIVPILGPIISGVAAAIVGFSISPIVGILAVALSVLVQQLENNILVPKVMQKVSGFSPLVVLIAILVGSELLGLVGALMAIPITMVLVIISKHVIRHSLK